MDGLAEYTVYIDGLPHSMLLSREDAIAAGVYREAAPAETVVEPETAVGGAAESDAEPVKPARRARAKK